MTLIIQILVALISSALLYICGKFNLGTEDVPATAGAMATGAGALLALAAGAILKWMQAKKIKTAESTVPGITSTNGPLAARTVILNDPTSPAPPTVTASGGSVGAGSGMKLPMRALLALLLLPALAMAGCGSTPRQRFNVAAVSFDVAVVGLAVAENQKPFPPLVWNQIQLNEQLAAARLGDAQAWLTANPALADVPGAHCPPLDPLQIALDVLVSQLHGVTIIVPSPTPPALQPTTTKP